MKRFVNLVFLLSIFSFSSAKYCKISDGSDLHLLCRPEDTKPIHFIREDSVGCENQTDVALRKNIKTIAVGTCSFDDFHLFKNFTSLQFSNFHETKLLRKEAFIGMDQVEQISIRYSNAEVFDAAFSDLPNLREVNINDNKLKLSDLAFKGAHQLRSVSLSDWLRSSLPAGFFRDLNNLEYLSLGRHFENLTDIDFTGLEKLKMLLLNMNHIRNLSGNSLDQLKSLKYLNFDYNRLEDIGTMEFSALGNLIFLSFDGNQIKELKAGALSGLSNLRCLILYNNYIRTIAPGAFSDLTNLKKLDLRNNRLNSLNANTFKGLRYLQYLRLRDNSISTIDVDTFANLPKLVQLDLSRQGGWPTANLEAVDFNAFPQFIDLPSKSVIQSQINEDSDKFENAELQWVKNIFSYTEDHQLNYYKSKFFGSFQLNEDNYPQTDLNSLSDGSQNEPINSLIFGNLDLSDNAITSINLVTKN